MLVEFAITFDSTSIPQNLMDRELADKRYLFLRSSLTEKRMGLFGSKIFIAHIPSLWYCPFSQKFFLFRSVAEV